MSETEEVAEIAGFTLLRSREEMEAMMDGEFWWRHCHFDTTPVTYPVFAMFIGNRGDSEWVTIYPADVAAMQAAFAALEEKP